MITFMIIIGGQWMEFNILKQQLYEPSGNLMTSDNNQWFIFNKKRTNV